MYNSRGPTADVGLPYFDGNANFFVTTHSSIDDLEYSSPFTSVAIEGHHQQGGSPSMSNARRFGPLDHDVVNTAAQLLTTLPLSAVTSRVVPIAAFGGVDPIDRKRVNIAREKWSSISFASDKEATVFHANLTDDIMALRLGWRRANTTVRLPDTVPAEALTYFKPSDKYGHGWEMFDAKKHVDTEALDRIAQKRMSAQREADFRATVVDKRLQRSASKLSRASSGSLSPDRRQASSLSPTRNGSPPAPEAGTSNKALAIDPFGVDVRRIISDEQVAGLFHPDEVANEIEKLRWDYKEFRPPAEWKRMHNRKMNALKCRAEAWRPMELKRENTEAAVVASRVTSMPALAPYYSSGLHDIDPKLPVPAVMQGSGVSEQMIQSLRLEQSFVVRQEGKGSSSATAAKSKIVAPLIIQGMSWGEIESKADQVAFE